MIGQLPLDHLTRLFIRVFMAACCLLAFFLQVHSAKASELGWSASFNDEHKLSNASSIPRGTRFQIGLFTGGFVPTAENVSEWTQHWRSRGETPFVDLGDGLTGFSGLLRVESNAAPFVIGAQLYIWGFRQISAGGSEWILATDPSWTMPDADPFSFPVFIDIADAAQVIIGQVDPENRSFSTGLVSVTSSPVFHPAEWLAQEFFQVELDNPLVSDLNADPDADGLTNIQEYTLGTPPKFFTSGSQSLLVTATPTGMLVQIPVNPTAVRSWNLQGGSTLATWAIEDDDLVYNGVEQIWARLHPLMSARHFWRLRFQ